MTIEKHAVETSPYGKGSASDLEALHGSIIAVSQSSTRDVGELLEHALSEAIRLTDSWIGCIYTYSEETRQFSLVTWSRKVMEECHVDGHRSERTLENAGLWAEAVRQRRPIVVNDAAGQTAHGLSPGHVEITRFLLVPVLNGGGIRAVVGIANKIAPYDAVDAHQLTLLMDSVWKTVELRRAESALQESEERFQQAQKFEAVGRLAGGIAHDFNNLLTVIQGYCELFLADKSGSGRELVREIQRAAGSATSLTAQLLAFSRKQLLNPKVLRLATMAKDMEHMLRRLIGEDIMLTIEAGAEAWSVRVDPGKMQQVVMNLAANARDAMPRGGHLSIVITNVTIGQKLASPHSEIPPGDYVRMAVSDTGIGMDETIRAHLFEPFFTTKPRGQGTGLGLATVYGICHQSDGHVFCHSAPGRGATFEIFLPRVHEEAGRRHDETPMPVSPTGGCERVLLVEDDDSVRGLIASILSGAGYHVTEVRNGDEALRRLGPGDGGFDLLVTDVVMPGMDGPEVAARIAKKCPTTGVLFVSGYAEGSMTGGRVPGQGAQFLQKPFTPETLLHKVREVLESRCEGGSSS